MWFLIGLAFPIVEVWLLFRVGSVIGLANTFFYLLACVVFGLGLIRSQAAYLTRTAQTSMAAGQMPNRQLLHSIALFVSGLFFVFPGYISSVIGLLLLLPGTRHLAIAFMKRKMQSMIQRGAMRFTAGTGGFQGFSQGFSWTSSNVRPPMRDVSPLHLETHVEQDVIDVTPTKKD